MRKLLVAVLAIAFASIAEAGVYHYQKYLFCYDCHTMHASQSHGYTGAMSATGALRGNWLPTVGIPSPALLKGSGSAVCTACHSNQVFAPNVIDGTNATQGARSAGGIGQTGGGGHALGGVNPPGGTMTSTSLECTNCHIQHGYASFRNLGSRSSANVTPTYAIRTASSNIYDGATDVFVQLTDSAATYTPVLGSSFNGYYQMANVSYQAITVGGVPLTNRLNNFCAQCHGTFHGQAGIAANIGGQDAVAAFAAETPPAIGASAGALMEFLRHPTAGVYVGQVSAHGHSTPPTNRTVGAAPLGAQPSFYSITNRVKFGRTNGAPPPITNATATSTSIYWDAGGIGWSGAGIAAGDRATVLCISCHNAHGSSKPFGLRFLTGNGTAPVDAALESGDGKYRNLCGQCHSQGAKGTETYSAPFPTDFP